MKLLLDANVSWRLAARLQSHFEECFHVSKAAYQLTSLGCVIPQLPPTTDLNLISLMGGFVRNLMIE